MTKIGVQFEVLISRDVESVFNYFSDLRNDKFWRKEANETTINTEKIELHTIIEQGSFLSKRVPNYITFFVCTEFVPNKAMICETDQDQKFWSKSIRITEAMKPDLTKVKYTVEFDFAFVKHGLGFNLPTFIIHLFLKKTIKSYLAQLKNNLEKR